MPLIQGLREIFRNDIWMIVLYGSVARNESTKESDIDIAIIMKKDMEESERECFIRWSVDMDIRYDKVFSIVDIQEEMLEKWGKVLPFYKNYVISETKEAVTDLVTVSFDFFDDICLPLKAKEINMDFSDLA